MAFVTDRSRPQAIWQRPPTAYLTASGPVSEVPSLLVHPWGGRGVGGAGMRLKTGRVGGLPLQYTDQLRTTRFKLPPTGHALARLDATMTEYKCRGSGTGGGEGGLRLRGREVSTAAAAAGTGGRKAGPVAVLVVRKWLGGGGGG